MLSRFYCPVPMRVGGAVVLPEGPAHHVLRVLRLRPGARLVLFDGREGEYTAELIECGKRAVARVLSFDPVARESACDIVLAQSLAAGDKMDWVVQKAVELGARRIVPLAAERSVVRLSGERAERRVFHWREVAASSCEQCGRNEVPAVDNVIPLRNWLGDLQADDAVRCVLAPGAPTPLSQLAARGRALVLLVGPEGGLSEGELAAAQACGFVAAALGPRVLRTETAGAAAIATWLAAHGEF